jgi:phytoene dehydrogenase-like protein
MGRKVIIIGGGIAGLSAGCYLRMNGYDTEIHELHSLPGGLCTAWKRQGYTFDGCIHWIVGTRGDDPWYKLWNELIDMKNVSFVDSHEFFRLHGTDGRHISVFTDIDKFEAELLAKAPQDAELVKEFTNAARRLSGFRMRFDKAPELYSALDTIRLVLGYLPYSGLIKKWMGISGRDFAARFRDPLTRKLFETMFMPDMAALFLVFMLVWMNKRSAGYPIGGSLEFARLIERRYTDLGGRMFYHSRVKEVVVEAGAARGIILENGEKRPADVVVSAADGHATIFDMLGGRFVDDKVRACYSDMQAFPSWAQVSLGVARTFDGLPGTMSYVLDKPVVVDDATKHDTVGVRIFNFDPTMAPAGKTALTVILPTANHEYWQKLRAADAAGYKAEKQRLADAVMDVLESKLGGIRDKVETVDVATPATVIRYTANWKGSLEGWVMTPKVGLRHMSRTLPGLRDFYMAGQWVEPGGGIPPAMMSGRNVAQIICRADGIRFATKSFQAAGN